MASKVPHPGAVLSLPFCFCLAQNLFFSPAKQIVGHKKLFKYLFTFSSCEHISLYFLGAVCVYVYDVRSSCPVWSNVYV